jgi:PIN domain
MFWNAMSLTYILVDFENVQPTAADMSLIRGTEYRVRIFHGPHQNKFDAEMVKALQPLGAQLEYFQCERKGKNALDFHIAFYLGRLVQECEAAVFSQGKRARFVIVSKDGGFDTLLGHVGALGYEAVRAGRIREALAPGEEADRAAAVESAAGTKPLPRKVVPGKPRTTEKKTPVPKAPAAKKVAKAAPPTKKAAKADPWLRVLGNLRDHPNNRPTTRTALERHLATMLGNSFTQAVVTKLIERLQREGMAVVNGNKIEYKIKDAN